LRISLYTNDPECVISHDQASDPDVVAVRSTTTTNIDIGCEDNAGVNCASFQVYLLCWGV